MDFHSYFNKRVRYDNNEDLPVNINEDDNKDESIDFDDKQLITQVKLYACLYQYKKKNEADKVREAWLTVANKLDKSVEHCRHRWTILRQRYCKLSRKRESEGLEDGKIPEKFSFYHFMKWIDPYIIRRKPAKKSNKNLGKEPHKVPHDNNELSSRTAASTVMQPKVDDENATNINQDTVKFISTSLTNRSNNNCNDVIDDGVVYEHQVIDASCSDFDCEYNITEDEPSSINSIPKVNDSTNLGLTNIATTEAASIVSIKEKCAKSTNTNDVQTLFDSSKSIIDDNSNDSTTIKMTEDSGSMEKLLRTTNDSPSHNMISTTILRQNIENDHDNAPQSTFYEGCRKQLGDITSKLNNALDNKRVPRKNNTKIQKTYELLGQLIEDNLIKIEDEIKKKKLNVI